jgi:hypothetical protein
MDRHGRSADPRWMSTVARTGLAVWIAGVVGCTGVAYAAQDVVITTSGDRLVGEIKSVAKDVPTFETDYSDADFKIKWEKIALIQSDRQFLVETFDGKRVSGSLKPAGLQPAGRLVFPDRIVRQLRQRTAGGVFQ